MEVSKWFFRFLFTIVFLGILLVYARTKKIIRSDGQGYYVQLRSLIIDGDLHHQNEYDLYVTEHHITKNALKRTKTDHVPNKYFIGPAIFWLPFFLIAHD